MQLWTCEVIKPLSEIKIWLNIIIFYYFCNQCWSALKCHSIFIISFGYLVYMALCQFASFVVMKKLEYFVINDMWSEVYICEFYCLDLVENLNVNCVHHHHHLSVGSSLKHRSDYIYHHTICRVNLSSLCSSGKKWKKSNFYLLSEYISSMKV